MRKDLDALLRPLEIAKRQRRRAAWRSRFAAAALFALIATTALLIHIGGHAIAANALLVVGLGILVDQLRRRPRMPEPIPREWLLLAVEARLSREGRAALTPMLMASDLSCDAALAWGRAEQQRFADDEPVRDRSAHMIGR